MKRLYLLQNQDNLLLGKQGVWLDGRESNLLYRAPHRDAALNQLVEVNSKSPDLRLRILECDANERGHPIVPVDQLPLPLPDLLADSENVEGSSEPSMQVEAESVGSPQAQ